MDLADKFKPDCQLKMLLFWPFRNKHITLFTSTIMLRVKV